MQRDACSFGGSYWSKLVESQGTKTLSVFRQVNLFEPQHFQYKKAQDTKFRINQINSMKDLVNKWQL